MSMGDSAGTKSDLRKRSPNLRVFRKRCPIRYWASANSYRQHVRYGNEYLKLLKLLLQTTLESFQVAQAVQRRRSPKVNDAHHHDTVVVRVGGRLPDALEGELPLDG